MKTSRLVLLPFCFAVIDGIHPGPQAPSPKIQQRWTLSDVGYGGHARSCSSSISPSHRGSSCSDGSLAVLVLSTSSSLQLCPKFTSCALLPHSTPSRSVLMIQVKHSLPLLLHYWFFLGRCMNSYSAIYVPNAVL